MGHKCKRPSFETPRKRAAPQDDVSTCGSVGGARRFRKICSILIRRMLLLPGWFLSMKMQYRGKRYIVVQGIDPDSWKWTVDLDEQTCKSGEAKTHGLAVSAVVLLVDRLLMRKPRSTAA
jgi:hypothetical protein